METKIYKTAKEFFKFLNNYEADIWIRGSKAYNINGELVAEYEYKTLIIIQYVEQETKLRNRRKPAIKHGWC